MKRTLSLELHGPCEVGVLEPNMGDLVYRVNECGEVVSGKVWLLNRKRGIVTLMDESVVNLDECYLLYPVNSENMNMV